MGIYIPGMEMPTEKYGTMNITIYPNGHVAEYVGDMGRVWTAIPVPAHGRPVVRGRWIRTDAYPHRLYCSVCFKTYLKNDELLERWEFPLNFCPNCGADMRKEEA